VLVDDEDRQATVVVPNDQLSLAIGKEGMNARLAARLTGWRIDIKSERTFQEEEAAAELGGDGSGEMGGRCAAFLRNDKRCVNAAVPGTRYCALPAHARLAAQEAAAGVPPPEAAPVAAPAAATATVEEEG
jgi:N utilization substance protein A